MTTLCSRHSRPCDLFREKSRGNLSFIFKKNSNMSPERAGSPQEEKVMTPKMSVPGSPVAGTPAARDDQSAFNILLEVAQSQSNKSPDDDLTSLSWLQNKDLLKDMNLVNPSPSNSVQTTPIKWNTASILSDQSPTSDYVDDSSISAADSSSSSLNSPIPLTPQPKAQQRYRHPHTIPYDPMIHVTNKPPYSFSCLIFMAIEDSQQKALPVKEIYAWIMDHFPYFKTAPTGWKNSVRHNLSLNKCFQKVEKAPNLGKGSLWTVDKQYRPNLLQALTRSPFHPCSTLDPSDYYNKSKQVEKTTYATTNSTRLPNPELFPYLSTEMSRLVKPEVSDSDSLDAVDAATVMLSLRNGPRYRMKKNMVITTSPSQDHTYSAAENQNGSNDEAFESDDERVPKTRRKIDFEDEEDRKIKEGAETLLNLAGIDTRKRTNSDCNGTPILAKRMRTDVDEAPIESVATHQSTERPTPFRPRLLRKKRDIKRIISNNNNNNTAQTDNEWAKQRRELELDQTR